MTTPQGRSLLTDGDETSFLGRLLSIARRTALEEGLGAVSTLRLARDAGVSRVAALFRVAFPDGAAPPRIGPRDALAPLAIYFTEGFDGTQDGARADLLLCALHGIILSQLGPRPGDWTEPGDLVALAISTARK